MSKKLQYRKAVVLFILLFFLPAAVAAGSQWETKEIASENESVIGDAISGDYIIFLSSGGMNQSDNRVKLYDIGSGDTNIIGKPSDGMMVTGEDISGDYAVWFETESMDNYDGNDSDTKPNSIYLMNIKENSTIVLELPGDAEWPKIEGDKIFWSNSSEDSFETEFYIYDITTGESELVLTADCMDPAGIVFSDGYVAYENDTSLNLFNIESEKETVVYAFESDNESGLNIDSFDMSGDYMIYITHSVVFDGDDKGVYYEPFIYTISTGKTESLNPETGEISESIALADKKTQLFSPFTDGNRAGWSYQDSDSESKIILFDPAFSNASTITANGSVDDICLDGSRMSWTMSVYPSFRSSLVYTEENAAEAETTPQSTSQSTPGFSFFTLTGSFLIIAIIFIKKQK